MERLNELEELHGSIAKLPPRSRVLDRDRAMELIRRLQVAEHRLNQLRNGLMKLVEEDGPSPS